MKKIIWLLIAVIALNGCSLQKRRYMGGFYVHKKTKAIPTLQTQKERPAANVYAEPGHSEVIFADAGIGMSPILKTNKEDSCDIIVLKNGDEISCFVLEVTPTEIKYKGCKSTSGPTMSIYSNTALFIRFADGEKQMIYSDEGAVTNPGNKNTTGVNTTSGDTKSLKTNGAAVTGFVLALAAPLISLLIPWVWVVGSVLALIFSIIGLNKIKDNPTKYKGKGLAVTGLVISLVSLALFTITVWLLLSV